MENAVEKEIFEESESNVSNSTAGTVFEEEEEEEVISVPSNPFFLLSSGKEIDRKKDNEVLTLFSKLVLINESIRCHHLIVLFLILSVRETEMV